MEVVIIGGVAEVRNCHNEVIGTMELQEEVYHVFAPMNKMQYTMSDLVDLARLVQVLNTGRPTNIGHHNKGCKS
jgi:hypothetical protein